MLFVLVSLIIILTIPLFVTRNENVDILFALMLNDIFMSELGMLNIPLLYFIVFVIGAWLIGLAVVYDNASKSKIKVGKVFTVNIHALSVMTFIVLAYTIFGVFTIMLVHIDGVSMQPAVDDNSVILFREKSYGYQRGDIVLHQDPDDPENYYLKRIIGMPGEHVLIDNGSIYVDGVELSETDYLHANTYTSCSGFDRRCEFDLAGNEYMVLGDNRNHSIDSRHYGVIARNNIRGSMIRQILPWR